MRIALATCRDLPDWEVDDAPLHAALRAAGADIAQPAWDDPATDWSGFDAVLIRTTWDYWHRRDAFVAWAERVEAATPLHNPAAVVRWNTDKRYLAALDAAGARIAPTAWLPRGAPVELAALMAARRWPTAFIKPTVGASASDTFRVTPGTGADAQAHLDALLRRHDVMVQPYLSRVETDGELSAIFIDGALSHAVQKIPVPGDYRVQDDYGASDRPHALTAAEAAAARGALAAAEAALGLAAPLLYARIDFLWGDGGEVYLNEAELVEPSLFFRHAPAAPAALAEALLKKVRV